MFTEADSAYGIEILPIDPYWCISELLESRNIELIDEDDDDGDDDQWH